MPLVTKFLSSIFQNGLKNLAVKESVASARQFHLMTRPLPKPLIENSTLSHSPVVNSLVSSPSLVTGLQRLLVPISSLINQVSGFKVKGHLKRRCKDCYFVIRQQRSYVICPTHRRHKQMSMKKKDYKSWILTHATQSKVRPY